MEFVLSTYGSVSTEPSPVGRMMAAFARDFRDGVDVNLGVGYVNEQTIPRELIREAFNAVISHNDAVDKPLNYGDPRGSARLIAAIRQHQLNTKRFSADVMDRNEIIVGCSGATSLLDAFANMLPPGIVITSDPVYYIYSNQLERMGFDVLAIPEDEEGIRIDALEQALGQLGQRKKDIRFLYIVTVNNPSSTILANERIERLVQIAEQLSEDLQRKIPLILDRAYEDLIHDPAVPPRISALTLDRTGLVYEVSTVSKILAPGLRIGYLIGPDGPLLQALIQRTCDAGFHAPPLNQDAAAYLLEHHLAGQIERVNAGYREKARTVRQGILDELGAELEDVRGGRGGFYFYLTFKQTQTHPESPFFRFLTRTTGDPAVDGPPDNPQPRVIYIPGIHCVHPAGQLTEIGKRQLRLSYGYEVADRILLALRFLRAAVDYAAQASGSRRR